MTSKNFTVKYRRKREGRTDYKLRMKLLKSNMPRLVVRKSNAAFTVQAYDYQSNGDKLLAEATSTQLAKLGWKYGGSNFPAAYLVGFIAGSKAKAKGVKELVVDFGLYRVMRKSKLYAAVRGVIDAGVQVRCSDKVLPEPEVCAGKRIADYAKLLLKDNKAKYDKQFSAYLKNSAKPEDIEGAFAQVKEAVGKQKW